ncbi:MAG: PAS domain-containing protein [Alphaproteobacteria bacterium]|nr:PAS domain-containing protein [Alphaproteobacteria bacterium]
MLLRDKAQVLVREWLALPKGENGLPLKTDLDPIPMASILPDVVLYERVRPDFFNIRLMGTRVCDRIGVKGKGMNALDLMTDTFRDLAREMFDRVLSEPCAHHFVVEDRIQTGRICTVEVVRLPLALPDGTGRFIVSSTHELSTVRYTAAEERTELLTNPLQSSFIALQDLQLYLDRSMTAPPAEA